MEMECEIRFPRSIGAMLGINVGHRTNRAENASRNEINRSPAQRYITRQHRPCRQKQKSGREASLTCPDCTICAHKCRPVKEIIARRRPAERKKLIDAHAHSPLAQIDSPGNPPTKNNNFCTYVVFLFTLPISLTLQFRVRLAFFSLAARCVCGCVR